MINIIYNLSLVHHAHDLMIKNDLLKILVHEKKKLLGINENQNLGRN